ncbi:hypothetical protein [Azospirillum largimobile]
MSLRAVTGAFTRRLTRRCRAPPRVVRLCVAMRTAGTAGMLIANGPPPI